MKMAVTKAGLIDAISETCDFQKKFSSTTIESLLEIMKETLVSGEDILISGFGKFSVKEKKERKGRNPQTGDDMMLGSRRIVSFKCSNSLRDRINLKTD
jgi:integration host factor subunit alpha